MLSTYVELVCMTFENYQAWGTGGKNGNNEAYVIQT